MMIRPAALVLLLPLLLSSGCGSFLAAIDSNAVEEDQGRRTFGARVEDESIETKAIVNIHAADAAFEGANIDVVSYNGYVLIAGQVPSAELKQKATDVVREIRKVRRIYNELEVGGNTSTLTRSSDTWLSAKVKSKLLAGSETEGSRVKVITENGVVYLMGLATEAEAARITEIASDTSGVVKVVRLFEIFEEGL